MTSKIGVSAIAIFGAASLATAAHQLQLDVNALNGQSYDSGGNAAAFGGTTHTGSIMLSGGINSALEEILINGAPQGIASGQFMSFSGTINLVNGGVTGGSLSLTLQNADTFTASIVGGVGQVNTQAGQGFSIDGLLTNALFSSASFAGVDITDWFSEQPINGSFLNFAFNPNGSGADTDTDIDIFVVVPSPVAGGMAGVGLLGLAARRRRA